MYVYIYAYAYAYIYMRMRMRSNVHVINKKLLIKKIIIFFVIKKIYINSNHNKNHEI